MENETLELIHKGESVLFTFKEEANRFAKTHDLTLAYKESDLLNDEHYEIKEYNAKLYWIAR